jgi:S1-C subfamily serine protease
VTNEHVVRDAQELTVQLASGEERPARIVAADDPFTDLAVIKVQAGGLTPLSWGDSDALQLGERVIAIGSALNEFQGSVTTGVVSGLHRSWLREGVMMEDLVQTDAAINHGNSGGALLNSRGELVGLNSTVIRSTDGGDIVEGIAFAISSKTAVPIVEAMVRDGAYPRAFLGIVHQDVDQDMAGFDLATDRGALVLRVSSGTPAADGSEGRRCHPQDGRHRAYAGDALHKRAGQSADRRSTGVRRSARRRRTHAGSESDRPREIA